MDTRQMFSEKLLDQSISQGQWLAGKLGHSEMSDLLSCCYLIYLSILYHYRYFKISHSLSLSL
jgi:hypothetical protein